jgi:hypothetical protein
VCFQEHGLRLFCPIHALCTFIMFVSHSAFVFSFFQFLCSVLTVFAMWQFEISPVSLSNRTCSRTRHFFRFYFLRSYILGYIEALAAHKVNTRHWTNLMAPHSHDIMPIDFILCGVLCRICLQ